MSVAVTEPNAGSDVAGVRVTAKKVDGGFVINGEKTWCTFAGRADVFILLARTGSAGQTAHKGLTLFLVEKPQAGSPTRSTASSTSTPRKAAASSRVTRSRRSATAACTRSRVVRGLLRPGREPGRRGGQGLHPADEGLRRWSYPDRGARCRPHGGRLPQGRRVRPRAQGLRQDARRITRCRRRSSCRWQPPSRPAVS